MADTGEASRLRSLTLAPSDIVIIVGLTSPAEYNYVSARVLDAPPEAPGLVAVRLLHGDRAKLSVARENLLKASLPSDRATLFTRVAWERQLELRVAAPLLSRALGGEEGLCLRVASYFPVRETLALTTGFAHGRIVPCWSRVAPPPGGVAGRIAWRPVDERAETGFVAHGEREVADGIARIDCAVACVGGGRFVVAGGCADHPSRCRAFFASAFLYDAVSHAVEPLPDMPSPRHGCRGAVVGGGCYVFGGEYVAKGQGGERPSQCTVLDMRTRRWTALSAEIPREFLGRGGVVAFVPFGAVWGRLVALVEGRLWAYNCTRPQDGWRRAFPAPPEGKLGTSAQSSVEWRRHLVVGQGRGAERGAGADEGCYVAAFGFLGPPEVPVEADSKGGDDFVPWHFGRWMRLGDVGTSGRIGSDLSVVHDRLYISGGFDEGRQVFDGSVARWEGTYSDLPPPLSERPIKWHDACQAGRLPTWAASGIDGDKARLAQGVLNDLRGCAKEWHVQPHLAMPTAMHAHSAITIPLIP